MTHTSAFPLACAAYQSRDTCDRIKTDYYQFLRREWKSGTNRANDPTNNDDPTYFHDKVPMLGLRDSRRHVPKGRSLQDAWIANVTWNLDCLLLYERKVLIE